MNTRVRTLASGSLGVVVGALLAVAALPAGASAQDQEVTFNRDVMPILQESCQSCHREGDIAPMSLMTYEETRPWARSIRDKVETRTMPPWYIDPNVGVQGFKYDRSLSQEQIDTIVAWVDAGAVTQSLRNRPLPSLKSCSPSKLRLADACENESALIGALEVPAPPAIASNACAFASRVARSRARAGSSRSLTSTATAMWIALGKTSLVDCERLT